MGRILRRDGSSSQASLSTEASRAKSCRAGVMSLAGIVKTAKRSLLGLASASLGGRPTVFIALSTL